MVGMADTYTARAGRETIVTDRPIAGTLADAEAEAEAEADHRTRMRELRMAQLRGNAHIDIDCTDPIAGCRHKHLARQAVYYGNPLADVLEAISERQSEAGLVEWAHWHNAIGAAKAEAEGRRW